jgi:nicotinamidase-related amidase
VRNPASRHLKSITSKMSKTALLIMDVQTGNVNRLSTLPPTYLPLMASTISTARTLSIPIIYIILSFRPGHPECSRLNPIFAPLTVPNSTLFVAGDPDTVIPPAIAPQDGDVVVVKKRVSAFAGSDLEVVLRSLGVRKLVLAGMSTGGVVLSTVCEAADKDFELVVLRDLCVDPSEELHGMLMDKIFKKRGQVVGAEEWIKGLEA